MSNYVPLSISAFKGEGRILIIPSIKHIGGYLIEAEWFANIKDVKDSEAIGLSIFNAVDFIKNAPRSIVAPKKFDLTAAWKKNSKYKNRVSLINQCGITYESKNPHVCNLHIS